MRLSELFENHKKVLVSKHQFSTAKLENIIDAAGHYGFDEKEIKKFWKSDELERTFKSKDNRISFYIAKTKDNDFKEAELYI